MIDVIHKYGEIETALKMSELQTYDYTQELKEDSEKADAKRTAMSNEFVTQMLQGMAQQHGQPGEQQQSAMQPQQVG
jgi:hypothetical protein